MWVYECRFDQLSESVRGETEEAPLTAKIRKLPVSKVANKLSHSTNEITFILCPGT